MIEEERYRELENKLHKMSSIWRKTLKDSFKDILLNGYKVNFKLEKAKSEANILPNKSNKSNIRSF